MTNVLQNLRSVVGKQVFDEWYEPRRQEMEADLLLKYLYRLRTEVLKEGTLQVSMSGRFDPPDLQDVRALMRDPPPGARSFFIEGGQRGGWRIEMPDGTIATQYVEIPEHLKRTVTERFHFADPPLTHLGRRLPDTSVAALALAYITYLERLVADAGVRFGK